MLELARRLGFQARAPRHGALTITIDRRVAPEDAEWPQAAPRSSPLAAWLARLAPRWPGQAVPQPGDT
jgi:hypothetical protein